MKDSAARQAANRYRLMNGSGQAIYNAIADKAGVATTIGVLGSGEAESGTCHVFESQSNALDVTIADGLFTGQQITVSQKEGAANAITLKDSGANTVGKLTPTAALATTIKLLWNGATWLPFDFGAGASTA